MILIKEPHFAKDKDAKSLHAVAFVISVWKSMRGKQKQTNKKKDEM